MYIGGIAPVPPLVMGIVILAAPALIYRSMINYWGGVSGKGNIHNYSKMAAK
jgi:hypothetical protein